MPAVKALVRQGPLGTRGWVLAVLSCGPGKFTLPWKMRQDPPTMRGGPATPSCTAEHNDRLGCGLCRPGPHPVGAVTPISMR